MSSVTWTDKHGFHYDVEWKPLVVHQQMANLDAYYDPDDGDDPVPGSWAYVKKNADQASAAPVRARDNENDDENDVPLPNRRRLIIDVDDAAMDDE